MRSPALEIPMHQAFKKHASHLSSNVCKLLTMFFKIIVHRRHACEISHEAPENFESIRESGYKDEKCGNLFSIKVNAKDNTT